MNKTVKTLLIVLGVSLILCLACGIIAVLFVPYAATSIAENTIETIVESNPELEQAIEDAGVDMDNLDLDELLNNEEALGEVIDNVLENNPQIGEALEESGIDTENLNLEDLLDEEVLENVMNNIVIEDEEKAGEVAQSIVNYQLPTGYKEEMAMELMGFKMVAMANSEGLEESDFVIMLIEAPPNMFSSDEQLKSMLTNALDQQDGLDNVEWVQVGEEDVAINGVTTQLTTYEATQDGETAKQATIAFETESGNPALVMFTGKEAYWDQAAVNAFLTSLRGTGR